MAQPSPPRSAPHPTAPPTPHPTTQIQPTAPSTSPPPSYEPGSPEDPNRVITVGEAQLAQSRLYELEGGVEAWKEAHDDRDIEARTKSKTVPGVNPPKDDSSVSHR